ncbi:MAG: GlcNAc-transferase family protein [Terrimicrobiaceae bacterium]
MLVIPQKESGIPLLIFSHDPFQDSSRHACRETWLPALRPEIKPLFLLNCPDLEVDQRFDGDVLRVRCANKETGLLERTRRGLRAVRERFTFRWLFVCNETCWVNSWRFNAYPFWDWDATGVWESGSGAMSLSRRAVNFLLQALGVGAESDLGGLLRDLPAAKILRAPLCIPYRADSWEPCLLAHGVSSPEAMRALHAKALRYETFIGCAPQQNGDSCACEPAPIVTGGFPLAVPPPKLPHECRVFIQIAAYRESDLTNSLRDLFSKAADPTRLRVGICWQHTEDESLDEFANDSRVRIDAIPACEAKGLGWARSRAQLLYDGEEFNLQIDGHTRFIEGWDEVLIGMLAQTDSPKPLLTTYPKGFVPGKPLPPGKPFSINVSYFRENGTWNQFPVELKNPESLSHPVPARSLAGGFYFTLGAHCREVPYDPSIYFSDENSMAVRSFTHGYDLFHPHRHILWHHYGRESAPRHWADHTEEAQRSGAARHFWWLREWRSVLQHQQLFGQADYGITIQLGFGNQRSVAAFEKFAGFDFRGRRLHVQTLAGLPPPIPYQDEESWDLELKCVIGR